MKSKRKRCSSSESEDDRRKSKSDRKSRRRHSKSRSSPKRSKRSRSRPRRSRSRSRSSSSDRRPRKHGPAKDETKPVHYNFNKFKSKLNRIFFRPEDFIKQGSPEYDEFWQFLGKYQDFEKRRKPAVPRTRAGSGEEEVLGIRSEYDKEETSSFSLLPADPLDLLNRISFQDSEGGSILTPDMVREFRHILQTFINFQQREKISKLRKLREAQKNLPIAAYREEILAAVKENQVVIVAGDTGCGKSTQVPQYLLQEGYKNIACTQPRRIACVSLANRVSHETLNQFGQEIGYQIRFEKQKTQNTKVVFLTEGLLLRQISSDASLSSYDVIVLDEVHERHLHGDFLLGVIRCLLLHREDLRLILMSATININLFKDYFEGQAPVIQVPGRLYPITLEYHPIPCVEDGDRVNPAPYVRILQVIDHKYPTSERGDLLIFLSGISEITRVLDACRQYAELNNKWVVLPLHSTLSLAEQEKVFDYPPEGIRKAIISTNIAETSVTIDGVRFVCDSGKVKEMTYDPVCKMQRLKEFWVSRASAEQRKGRAGRTGPGVCFRLYAESEYASFSPYSKPEIERVPLDSLILQMIAMGLPDARKFPFIESPPPESLENSIMVLKEQGALTADERLTTMGKMLSNLPVDVSIGKILINGSLFHQVDSILTLAAALSVQSPFTNKAFKDSDCMASRRSLDSDHGDPLTLLNAFREWLKIKSEERENSRKWCRKRGLEEQRFYEMIKLRRQFEDLLRDSGLIEEDRRRSENLSSSQRSARHGELKQLRETKRNHQKEGPRRKRTLKIGDGELEEEDEEVDMGDIDFRLRNDAGRVEDLLRSSRAVSYTDLTMLKLILTCGLYPQFATGDEHNSYKPGSEQLFHARVKPFNVLHPNCIFASQPEVLQLESLDIVDLPGYGSKHPPSCKHQLLVYISLLETNKPYLTASIRAPALPILLLFSQSMETNGDMSRIIFDAWLEVRIADTESAQNQLLTAHRLRRQWLLLLNSKLEDAVNTIKSSDDTKLEQQRLESSLSTGLVDFLHNETVYSVKRLLPADIKVAYVGRGLGFFEDLKNPFDRELDAARHPVKGGMVLTEQITYNCLAGDLTGAEKTGWKCPNCQMEDMLVPLERLHHFAVCSEAEQLTNLRRELAKQDADIRSADPRFQQYSCDNCGNHLSLTPIEILKHKKSCAAR